MYRFSNSWFIIALVKIRQSININNITRHFCLQQLFVGLCR